MGGTSTKSFEFLQKVFQGCVDFAEFDQVVYIEQGLHGSAEGRSVYVGGVCAGRELCRAQSA